MSRITVGGSMTMETSENKEEEEIHYAINRRIAFDRKGRAYKLY